MQHRQIKRSIPKKMNERSKWEHCSYFGILRRKVLLRKWLFKPSNPAVLNGNIVKQQWCILVLMSHNCLCKSRNTYTVLCYRKQRAKNRGSLPEHLRWSRAQWVCKGCSVVCYCADVCTFGLPSQILWSPYQSTRAATVSTFSQVTTLPLTLFKG